MQNLVRKGMRVQMPREMKFRVRPCVFEFFEEMAKEADLGAGVGCHFGLADLIVFFFEWLGGKIVTLMCRSQRGFELAYKLGWARPGIDYFDCGQDCDKCPNYAECNNELRVPLDDVTLNSDSGAGS